MLRNKLALLMLVPALTLGLASCAADVDSGEDVEEAESEVTKSPLFGTFAAESNQVGALTQIALLSDATYHRTINLHCMQGYCVKGAQDGTYHPYRIRGMDYLALYPDNEAPAELYQFVLAGDTLRLQKANESTVFALQRTIEQAWCAEKHDCGMQNLPAGLCVGTWDCAESQNICAYSCRSLFEEDFPEGLEPPGW